MGLVLRMRRRALPMGLLNGLGRVVGVGVLEALRLTARRRA